MDSVEISHRKFAKTVTIFLIMYHSATHSHQSTILFKNTNFQKLDIDLCQVTYSSHSLIRKPNLLILNESKKNWEIGYMINLYHFPLIYRSDYFREVNRCYHAGQHSDLLNLILRQVT